jgi:hypothetical protein
MPLRLAASATNKPCNLTGSISRRWCPHLAWSSWRGHFYPDLRLLIRTIAALTRIAEHIRLPQKARKSRLIIGSSLHYLRLSQHNWSAIDILAELVRCGGCVMLIDVNNVHVGAYNLWLDARAHLVSRGRARSCRQHTADPGAPAGL